MTDTLSPADRSLRMSKIRAKNTKPEMLVRCLIYGAGYRYRLHDGRILGKPDLVFKRRRKLIFINGCFWHHHESCVLARFPKTNQEFWVKKLCANKARDEGNYERLRNDGWGVLVVWECELRDPKKVLSRIEDFLGPARKKAC
ncbi:very short patch repair endonuclease [Achromobacter xylosoxidans]|uniref:very short patch repair endonuclease n=1 Tax=Alcaligenes xylosoxydans xylosoxydans TaxID=85698 RepID=UPI000B4934E3|nr:DNA mismatch endonuclease Vsr [Achromobacter xylosoxidans]